MELALAIRQIWRRRIWLVVVAVVAALVATAVAYRVSILPPGLHSRSLTYGTAGSQILIQPAKPGALAKITATDVITTQQASVYAALLQSQPVRREIGAEARIPWPLISVQGHTTASSEEVAHSTETNASQRSAELAARGRAVSLFFNLEPEVPIINLYAQAPNAELARRLIAGASAGLGAYVATLQSRNRTAPWQKVELVRLGPPEVGTVGSGANVALAIVAGLLTFAVGCLLIVMVPRFAIALRATGASEVTGDPPMRVPPAPSVEQLEENGAGYGRRPVPPPLSDGR